METRNIVLIGCASPDWLHLLDQESSGMGLHLIPVATCKEGLEIVRQYNEIIHCVAVNSSSVETSDQVENITLQARSLSPNICVTIIQGEPHEVLCQLGRALGNDASAQLSAPTLPIPLVTISELPAVARNSALYVAEFAFVLKTCLVARSAMEERIVQSAAIQWHLDFLSTLSLLDADVQFELRYVHLPENETPLTVALTGHVRAATSNAAKRSAEQISAQLVHFLTTGGSCSGNLYGFIPVLDENQVRGFISPFEFAATRVFQNKCAVLDEGALPGLPCADSFQIPLLPHSSYMSPLHKLSDVLTREPVPAMVELMLRPTRLTADEIQILRTVRNNLWKQEFELTYAELQSINLGIDDLLRSCEPVFLVGCRLSYSGEQVPETLISTLAGEFAFPLSETSSLSLTEATNLDWQYAREFSRLKFAASLRRAVQLFRLPLPARTLRYGTSGSHPLFDYIPPQLATKGPLVGVKSVGSVTKEIRIDPDDLRRHVYALGQTGTGKSTMLRSMIMERVKSGRGICLIDPHGDLLSGLYSQLNKHQRARTLIFDPSDVSNALGLNMLEYDPAHPEQKTLLVNEMISIFDMLYDLRQTGGPIFEQYMRNAMLLVMDKPTQQGTLADVVRVFQESEYRKELIELCKNELVKSFWLEAIRTKGDAGLEYLSPYITSKLNQFISNDYIFPIISQRKSGLDFRKLIDSKKILLVKLSKGKLGEMGVKLLGMVFFARLLLAALSRDDIPENAREDFCLFVDEFQNFTSESVAQMLCEARKYRLNLVLANQTLGQLRRSIFESVLGNVGSLVFFRPGVNDFERIKPYIDPPFQREEVLNLPNHVAIGKFLFHGIPNLPFVFETVPPSNQNNK